MYIYLFINIITTIIYVLAPKEKSWLRLYPWSYEVWPFILEKLHIVGGWGCMHKERLLYSCPAVLHSYVI
jgi:hypothetical protein